MKVEELLKETRSYMNKANNECNNEAEDYFFQICLALLTLQREQNSAHKAKAIDNRNEILSKIYKGLSILEDESGMDVEVVSVQYAERVIREVLG